MLAKSLAVPAAILGLVVALTACSPASSIKHADPRETPVSDITPDETVEEKPTPTPEPEVEAGSLESPMPRGAAMEIYSGSEDNVIASVSAVVKDWNAGAAIAQANQFNEAAQPGTHYVAVEYTFTGKNKTEPANVSYLLTDWTLATEDGTLIADTSVVLPDGWPESYDLPDLYQGQTGTAVVVYQVPDAAAALFAQAYGKYVTL